ncbi:alcohol dehydrogenase family protein [Oceanospirillum linum]|uniref:Alcohol dehydrogenase n=1 Tax=Oceanospirillum linum TaxID=966 RepID=A0A1T1HA24_OCELI|nr:alcohol dehydrogenase family protein [Oceanospirillum linum]OOV86709.1 alcohol dehydrogenase [Oceanospirillum linum]SEG25484.1 NADPH:quinone reductase [Oleiphilus messinensis]SMP27919.1 NADPH:quinone reductase [Oceanospirillum linum]
MKSYSIPDLMSGVVLVGHGGPEMLEYRQDLPVPLPAAGEVLIRVGASAVNNTDINTRIGWYSKSIRDATNRGSEIGFESLNHGDASWSGSPLSFPRIQGADCCGTVIATGDGVDHQLIDQRVLVRPMYSPTVDALPYELETFGSECDGGFAEYTVAPVHEVFPVKSTLTDEELASFPCAYSTAEGMLERAGLKAGERVLITGASGGVGSAAIQLAKRRGAEVVAICSEHKSQVVKELGADQVIGRDAPLLEHLPTESVQVVVDLVGGDSWSELLEVLVRGGRYVVSGAIAGPLVELDLRTLYLKDLSLLGSTWQPRQVFDNLIRYIEQGEISPQVAQVYPLHELQQAQRDFIRKEKAGKRVIRIG